VPGFHNEMLHDLEDAREMQLVGSTCRLEVSAAASGGLLLAFPNGFMGYLPFRLLARASRERLELEGLAREELGRNGEGDDPAGSARRVAVEAKRLQALESMVGRELEVAVCHVDLHTVNRVAVVLMEASLAEDIARAEAMLESGRPALFAIEAATNSGVALDMGHGLEAFLPYSLLGSTTRRGVDARLAALAAEAPQRDPKRLRRLALGGLVGRELSLCVAEVQQRPGRPGKVILSEKGARDYWAGLADAAGPSHVLKPGDRVRGVVQNVKPYGVFVDIHHAEGVFVGLVHKSELAWGPPPEDWEARYTVGEALEVEVVDARGEDDAKAPRPVTLSVRRLTVDPSKQTFRDIGTGGDRGGPGGADASAAPLPLPGIPEFLRLCSALQGSVGVSAVEVQDCRHAPSFVPEMQVFLSSEDIPGGFELVCRRGIMLQSALVRTSLARGVIKGLLQELSAGQESSSGAEAD